MIDLAVWDKNVAWTRKMIFGMQSFLRFLLKETHRRKWGNSSDALQALHDGRCVVNAWRGNVLIVLELLLGRATHRSGERSPPMCAEPTRGQDDSGIQLPLLFY